MGEITHTVKALNGYEIIIRKLSGDICIDEIIKSFKHIQENLLSGNTIGILTDICNAKLKFEISKLPKILTFIIKNKNIRKLKLAIVADSPGNVTFPMIAKNKMPVLRIQVFSRTEAALKWLLE